MIQTMPLRPGRKEFEDPEGLGFLPALHLQSHISSVTVYNIKTKSEGQGIGLLYLFVSWSS